jgi:hypothetical protein
LLRRSSLPSQAKARLRRSQCTSLSTGKAVADMTASNGMNGCRHWRALSKCHPPPPYPSCFCTSQSTAHKKWRGTGGGVAFQPESHVAVNSFAPSLFHRGTGAIKFNPHTVLIERHTYLLSYQSTSLVSSNNKRASAFGAPHDLLQAGSRLVGRDTDPQKNRPHRQVNNTGTSRRS